jgi:hypothetical protein
VITDEVFNQLKANHKNLTENEFAKSYLGTSRSYLSGPFIHHTHQRFLKLTR